MTTTVKIGKKQPCFIIAEVGVNHNGSVKVAKQLVDAAKEAGVDAVKFQTFRTKHLVGRGAPGADYQHKNMGQNISQYDMLRKLELSYDEFYEIATYCESKKLLFLSTPFDKESADFLDSLQVPLFKISSGDLTHHSFLHYVAQKGRMMIVSTGMAGIDDVRAAVMAMKMEHAPLVLLHCVSNYPAAPKDVNLKAMDTLAREFGVPVGFSDHTLGCHVAVAAVARGACVVEKHFTLDVNMPGPDHKASVEPHELKALVRQIRDIEMALGNGEKKQVDSEHNVAAAARKSWVAACDLRGGTVLHKEMLAFRRPGTGLAEKDLGLLLNRTLIHDIREGMVIKPKDVVF